MYVFDLDGTLVESVDAHMAAWEEALEALGRPAERGLLEGLMGLPALEIARRLMPERARELADLKNRLFLQRHLHMVRRYEDAEVLAELPRPIAVVTSSSGFVARRILEFVGLAGHVDLVLGGDEVARGKPAPDPLYAVSRAFRLPTSRMVVVGDTDYDMAMAKAAGAVAVCVARRGGCRGADAVVTSLRQLKNLALAGGR